MKKSREYTINLEDYRVIGNNGTVAKVFTGRDRGKDVRINSKIDEIESEYDEVKIIIPGNIYSINPSFFEELFVNVVKKLGKEGFEKKFKFQPDVNSENTYNYDRSLTEAIIRILRTKTALG